MRVLLNKTGAVRQVLTVIRKTGRLPTGGRQQLKSGQEMVAQRGGGEMAMELHISAESGRTRPRDRKSSNVNSLSEGLRQPSEPGTLSMAVSLNMAEMDSGG